MNQRDAERFNAEVYRKSNADLAASDLSDEQLKAHFIEIGRAEQRVFALANSTAEYLSMRWLRGNGIEIGAGSARTPVFGGASVVYADIEGGGSIFGASDVRIRYSIDDEVPLELKGQFDFAVLSHVLEHSDGVIGALRHLLDLLKPGGLAYIAVPDMRYLVDKEWMQEYPLAHHVDEFTSPGIYDAEHDRAALSSLLRHPELSNPSGDHQVFHDDPNASTAGGFAKPDFRNLLRGNSKANAFRFAIHKHTYSPNGWSRIFSDLQYYMNDAFEIVETRYGLERQDCHFVLQKCTELAALEGSLLVGAQVTIGISYFRNAHLVDNIIEVLPALIASPLVYRVILINDSPDDLALTARLRFLVHEPKVQLVENIENMCYTRAINQAYRFAKNHGTNLACINSDVKFTLDILEEIFAISCLDTQIGFVFPRADSDPLFGLTGVLARDPELRRKTLPRFHFTPTAVGYFLYITRAVVDRLDGFDELFSPGYEEENDFVMRAGAVGFRAALANHVLVNHATSSSFSDRASALKEKHHAMLLERHPYYLPLVHDFMKSPAQQVDRIANRLHHGDDILIDCYGFPPVLNGTTIYARDLLIALNTCNDRDARVITVLIREDVYDLLELHSLSRLRFCHDPDDAKPHFNLLRVAQPFEPGILLRSLEKSLCSVNIFFDTIAQDIPSLRSPLTEVIWNDLTHVYRNIIFISDASRRTFCARYPVRGAALHVVHPSLDVSDYGPSALNGSPTAEARVLVVGNKFPHKDIRHTMGLLMGSGTIRALNFDVLTDSELAVSGRLQIHKSGNLSQQQITRLYSSCRFVVYPSYYEGFGLPLMEALHFKRPVVARRSALNLELKALLGPIAVNIHLFESTDELLAILGDSPVWQEFAPTSPTNWEAVARQVLSIVDSAARNFDHSQRCDARTVVMSRVYQFQPGVAVAPPGPMPASPSLLPSPADGLVRRVEELRDRFPFSFRVARLLYRKFLK